MCELYPNDVVVFVGFVFPHRKIVPKIVRKIEMTKSSLGSLSMPHSDLTEKISYSNVIVCPSSYIYSMGFLKIAFKRSEHHYKLL